LNNSAVIRGKLVRLQKPSTRDYALDLSEPICIEGLKGKPAKIKRLIIVVENATSDKTLRKVVGRFVTLYFSSLEADDGDPLAVVGVYAAVHRR
jgi:hypothetical protein